MPLFGKSGVERLRAGLVRVRPGFEFTRNREVPFARAGARPRLSLISSAGLVAPGQAPFDLTLEAGDPTFRSIPVATPDAELAISWDPERRLPASADLSTVFPVDALRGEDSRGAIRLAETAWSFSGAIPDPTGLLGRTAPELARALLADGVSAAFLVPA